MHMLSYLILGVSRLTLAHMLSKQASWQPLTVVLIKSLTWLWLGALTETFGTWILDHCACWTFDTLVHPQSGFHKCRQVVLVSRIISFTQIRVWHFIAMLLWSLGRLVFCFCMLFPSFPLALVARFSTQYTMLEVPEISRKFPNKNFNLPSELAHPFWSTTANLFTLALTPRRQASNVQLVDSQDLAFPHIDFYPRARLLIVAQI